MSNPGKRSTDDDEVEQLLRAAQDDMILKLNLNSHMARASGSATIDPDLDRRFQALKKPQKPMKVEDSTKRVPTKMDTGDNKVDGVTADDDLLARFVELKTSLPSYNRSDLPSDVSISQQETEEESEDEVEKVIKWATDAARLDPSSPSDDEDDENDDDDDSDGVHGGKKGKRK